MNGEDCVMGGLAEQLFLLGGWFERFSNDNKQQRGRGRGRGEGERRKEADQLTFTLNGRAIVVVVTRAAPDDLQLPMPPSSQSLQLLPLVEDCQLNTPAF